jgi:hypothetical protein
MGSVFSLLHWLLSGQKFKRGSKNAYQRARCGDASAGGNECRRSEQIHA